MTTLLSGLISYWKLDEESGTRVDSVGSEDLSDNNTVTFETGKIGSRNAATFVNANDEYLEADGDIGLNDDDEFTIAGWVKLASNSANRHLVTKWEQVAEGRSFLLLYDQAIDRYAWLLSDNTDTPGTTSTRINADNFGSPSTDTWHFIVCWKTNTGNPTDSIWIQVNDGTVDTTGTDSDGYFAAPNTAFRLGAIVANLTPSHDGALDGWGLWNRALTSSERSELYNSGNGLDYPFLAQHKTLFIFGDM